MKTSHKYGACIFKSFALICFFLSCKTFPASASSSPPVAGLLQEIVAGSHRDVATAVERPSAYQGYVGSISGNRVIFRDAPAWAADLFAPSASASPLPSYYLRFVTGALEGRWFRITGSDASGVTLDLPAGPSPLGAVVSWNATTKQGDVAKIVPFVTPRSWFQQSTDAAPQGFQPTDGSTAGSVLVVLAPTANAGQDPAIVARLNYRTATTSNPPQPAGWYLAGTNTRADHYPLPPGGAFQITNPGPQARSAVQSGMVVMHKSAVVVSRESGMRIDHYLSFENPVPIMLTNLGLEKSSAFFSSSAVASIADLAFLPVTSGSLAEWRGLFHLAGASGGWRDAENPTSISLPRMAFLPAGSPTIVQTVGDQTTSSVLAIESAGMTGLGGIYSLESEHPADANANFKIEIGELTAYIAAFRQGNDWIKPPVNIPIGYVTRAIFLWRNGESYRVDPAVEGPLRFVVFSE
jgi:uncharacterized protein (TIGR02597 family)